MSLSNKICSMRAAVNPILLGLFFSFTALPFQAQTHRDSHVVVISLDGFSAQSLRNPHLPLPNLRKLMAEGAYSMAMVPINPTVTWPESHSYRDWRGRIRSRGAVQRPARKKRFQN